MAIGLHTVRSGSQLSKGTAFPGNVSGRVLVRPYKDGPIEEVPAPAGRSVG